MGSSHEIRKPAGFTKLVRRAIFLAQRITLFVVLITEGQKFSGISHKCRAVLPFSWRYLYDYSQNLQWPSIYVQGCEYG